MSNSKQPISDQRLDELLQGLTEHHPREAVWSRIEGCLPAPRRFLKPALAASFIGVMLTASLLWQGKGSHPEQQITQQFQTQKQHLIAELQASNSWVDDWQYQLKLMADATLQIQHALAATPNDPMLIQMLQQIYQQQIEFIKNIQTHNSMANRAYQGERDEHSL